MQAFTLQGDSNIPWSVNFYTQMYVTLVPALFYGAKVFFVRAVPKKNLC